MADVLILRGRVTPVVEEYHVERMKEAAGGEVYRCATEDEALEKGYDAEVLLFSGGTGKMPEAWCNQSKKLKWAHTFSSGVNQIAASSMADLPIKLTNAQGVPATSMAVMTLGYILAFMKMLPKHMEDKQRHVWDKPQAPKLPKNPSGQTVVILGAGAIGAEVARLCKAMDMYVIGVKRSPAELPNYDEIYVSEDKMAAVARADYLVVLTPLTDETLNMVDYEFLKQMKPDSVFINISRGPVVNEVDLARALQEGVIAGAALDTFVHEPLPQDSPLWDISNVIITPHSCYLSADYMDNVIELFCENLRRYNRGEKLLNEVDMESLKCSISHEVQHVEVPRK